MKKILLSTLCAFALFTNGSAQCSTSSAPTNNCASFADQIDSFTLNGIASLGSAGCSASGYGSFNTPVWNLQIGTTYTFFATVGGGTYSEGYAIWIDFNNDGFYTAGEAAYVGASAASHFSTITVPYTAVVGNNIRMRTMCTFGTISSSDACSSGLNNYGETEDYFVNITCPAGLPTLSVTASNTFVCAGSSVTLTASGASSYTWTGGITNGVAFNPMATTNYTLTGGISGCPSSTATAVATISVTNIPLPVAALSSSSVVCAGHTASLNAGGANNYTWTPGNITGPTTIVSPQSTTIYTVIGYNGSGCPGTATLSLLVNPNPTVSSASSSTNVCAGQSATLTAFGAASYSWQTGSTSSVVVVSPTTPTAYTVYGTNSFGCTSSTAQVVLVSPSPTLTVIASNTLICLGGSVTFSANSTSNNYSWSTGATSATETVSPVTNTSYTVSSTNNVCAAIQIINISVFTQSLTVSPSTAICMGSTVSLNASGGTTYLWSDGSTSSGISVSPNTSTVYIVTANTQTNNMSCASSGTINVTVNPNPTVSVAFSKSTICKGESSIITASGANSYLWNSGETTASISVAPTSNTNYTVTGSDATNCSNTQTLSLKVLPCVGINELGGGAQYELTIYPNPSNGEFTIKSDVSISLNMINELGQTIRTITLNDANSHEIYVNDIANGIYFLVGKNESVKVNQKIVVAK